MFSNSHARSFLWQISPKLQTLHMKLVSFESPIHTLYNSINLGYLLFSTYVRRKVMEIVQIGLSGIRLNASC